jgi:hypothetical protein
VRSRSAKARIPEFEITKACFFFVSNDQTSLPGYSRTLSRWSRKLEPGTVGFLICSAFAEKARVRDCVSVTAQYSVDGDGLIASEKPVIVQAIYITQVQ